MNKTYTTILYCFVFATACIQPTFGAEKKLSINLSDSVLRINEHTIALTNLDAEISQFKTESLEYPQDSYYIELDGYPLAFKRSYHNPIHSIFVRYKDEVEVQYGDTIINNQTSISDIEGILLRDKVEYTKYVKPTGDVRIDSSLDDHVIVQVAFEDKKITAIELRLRKRPSSEAKTYSSYINHREVSCSTFGKGEAIFTYPTTLAKIELRISDLKESLREHIEKYNMDQDKLLLTQLERADGSIQLESISPELRERVDFQVSDLLQSGKCKVFDLLKRQPAQSIIVADWSTITTGTVFLFKNCNTEFFKVETGIF